MYDVIKLFLAASVDSLGDGPVEDVDGRVGGPVVVSAGRRFRPQAVEKVLEKVRA
jgi:hypothetical protein